MASYLNCFLQMPNQLGCFTVKQIVSNASKEILRLKRLKVALQNKILFYFS